MNFLLGHHALGGFPGHADFRRIRRERFDIVCRDESKSATFVRRRTLDGYQRPFIGFVVYDQGSVFGYGYFVFCRGFVFVQRFGITEGSRL